MDNRNDKNKTATLSSQNIALTLLMLFILLCTPSYDRPIFIAFFAIYFALVWFGQMYLSPLWVTWRIRQSVLRFHKCIKKQISALGSSSSPVYLVLGIKHTASEPQITGTTIEHYFYKLNEKENVYLSMQVYEKINDTYRPKELSELPQSVLESIDTGYKKLDAQIATLMASAAQHREYADRVLWWIKLVGLLASWNLLSKLALYV